MYLGHINGGNIVEAIRIELTSVALSHVVVSEKFFLAVVENPKLSPCLPQAGPIRTPHGGPFPVHPYY
jgi:hypothetical protein